MLKKPPLQGDPQYRDVLYKASEIGNLVNRKTILVDKIRTLEDMLMSKDDIYGYISHTDPQYVMLDNDDCQYLIDKANEDIAKIDTELVELLNY